jgi:hypothetical protein
MAPPAGHPEQFWILAMLFVNKGSRNSARSGIEVFVTTPNSEVNLIFVQGEWYIAYCVGKVKAYIRANFVTGSGDGTHIEELA